MRDSLSVLSKRELINLLRRKPCGFDDADLQMLCGATMQRLTVLRQRAREGKCLEEASEFGRWVLSSGLMKLFRGEGAGDVETLRKGLLWDCEEAWKGHRQEPWVAKSELEALNAKLDGLARLVGPMARRAEAARVEEGPVHLLEA